jgi:hypothetical protein
MYSEEIQELPYAILLYYKSSTADSLWKFRGKKKEQV